MRNRQWILGLGLLCIWSAYEPQLGESATFKYQVEMVELPELFDDGQLFLDPEIASGNWFGGGVEVGDWNRDGKNDLFISSFLADPDGVANAGAIYVFLGPDFSNYERITALPEPEEGDNFGMQVAVHDMNNDQIDDLVVTGLRTRYYPEDGSGMLDQAGCFRIVWGPDYSEGLKFYEEVPETKGNLGRGLAVGDFDEDGHQDVAVGVIGAYSGTGKVLFRYGPDYLRQTELFTAIVDEKMRFGVNLGTGDWNNDGHLDLLVGADYAYSETGIENAGHLQVWLGPNYREEDVQILEEPHPSANNNFGASIDYGDLTGDGIPDLVVGKSGAQWEGKGWVGQVMIFVGPDFSNTLELNSPLREENSIFGSEIRIADVNSDGMNDLVVGEYYATVEGKTMAGRAWLFLGIKTAVTDWQLF